MQTNVPLVHHLLVLNGHLSNIFNVSLSCAFHFRMFISSLHHSFTSSMVFLFLFSLSSPRYTTPFTSLLSSILQMCPNKFNFLSLIFCTMFLLLLTLSLTSASR